MDITDIKLAAINLAALVISFTEIEVILKICLLTVSIGYTITTWKEIYKTDSERKETYEQSIEIYRYIKKIYEEYKIPLYEIKPDTLENRVIEIFKYLKLNHFINF